MTHEPDAAQRRLDELLGGLRDEPPEPARRLPDTVMRTARWQYAVRGAVVVVSELSVAAGTLVRILASGGRS